MPASALPQSGVPSPATSPPPVLERQPRSVTVIGTVIQTTITVNPTSLNLGTTTAGTAGTSKTYVVSAQNISVHLDIVAPTGVELSTNGVTFTPSLEIFGGDSIPDTTITVRISASAAVGNIADNVVNSTDPGGPTFALTNLAVSGTVSPLAATPTITLGNTPLDLGSTRFGLAGLSSIFEISGSNLTAPITVTAPAGVELSKDGGATYSASLTLTPVAGVVNVTDLNARISATAAGGAIAGNITAASTGAATRSVAVIGTVIQTTITVNPSSLNLGTTTAGTAGAGKTYVVSAQNISVHLDIVAPTGVELSTNGVTFTPSLEIFGGDSIPDTTITVRISASAAVGNIADNIVNSTDPGGPTFALTNVAVSGTVSPLVGGGTIVVSPALIDFGETRVGLENLGTEFDISGTGLSGPITVTAPAGVEVSSDNGATYHATLSLPAAGGIVDLTNLKARIKSTAPAGVISGNIACSSPGTPTKNIAVTGSVIQTTITVNPSSLNLGSTSFGTAGASKTYVISAHNLTSSVNITAPAGVELSKDGTNFTSTLQLLTGVDLPDTTITVRIGAGHGSRETSQA